MSRPRRSIAAAILILVAASCSPASAPSALPTPLGSRPNILLFFTDDQSMKSVVKMPFLNRRPDGHWVHFKNAFISTPLCCPSRATMLTGQYSFRTGVIGNDGRPLDDSSTLATWLSDEGYRTALVGKYLNYIAKDKGETYIPPGWDYWVSLVTYNYFNYTLNDNGKVVSHGSDPDDYLTDVLTQKGLAFLRQPSTDPFFLWMSYRAPHKPTIPAPRHRNALKDWEPRLEPSFNENTGKPKWLQGLPKLDREEMKEKYRDEARTMLSVDESIRDVFSLLRSADKLDNTVVIFMTDNGYSRGQHRWRNKSCVYDECVRTPMLIRYPQAPSGGATFEQLVANDDMAPTILELAGAEAGLPGDGYSIVSFLDGSAPDRWRSGLLLNLRLEGNRVPPYWAIRTQRWKYVELSTGERELYHLSEDPYERFNLAGDSHFQSRRESLARRLERLRQ